MKNENKDKERQLTEEELNNVSGGSGGCDSKERYSVDYASGPQGVTFVAQIGEEIEHKYNSKRVKAVVIKTRISNNNLSNNQSGDVNYWDEYKVRNLDGSNKEPWIRRISIYKK